MLKWFITNDWNTPSPTHRGQGEGKDKREVCKAVKAWIDAHMPQFSDRDIWRFITLEDKSGTVIDFGSWTVFAKMIKSPNIPDIIIPLGNGSKSNNDELRILLRSIEKNGRNYGTIWIVTDCAPRWLAGGHGLAFLRCGDPYKHNKDANIIEKVRLAMQVSIAEEVVWTCDDCAILQPCDFSTLPVTWNNKGAAKFSDESIWGRRMRATLKELGMETVGHFDTHAPQRMNSLAAREAIAATPYTDEVGRCINTAILGRIHGNRIPEGAVRQGELKETAEKAKVGRRTPLERMFVGYNNRGFKTLRARLFERFPVPSKWEVQE